ncbi:MAG TPA: hypothetical protein VKX16_14200 [Chloroflexota bacterium]|nr:hypothetical protein [Chloroflexota bacterium]
MFRLLILFFALMMVISLVAFVVLSALALLAMACLVGIPLYFMSRPWLHQKRVPAVAQSPIERLQNLYVEGKIDLTEFERRVARLVAIEH